MSNQTINSLWIGSELSHLEQLTIKSFIRHGHTFQLWTYDEVSNIPIGTQVRDANEIIAQEAVFRRKIQDPYGIGKNSYALFSDLFRYQLLYLQGGWWVDMDVTCLRPFDVPSDYFFRAHPIISAVGNVMKAPKKAPVMMAAYEKTSLYCNDLTEDWLAANRLLSEQIEEHQLNAYIHDDYSAPDWWEIIEPYLYLDIGLPDDWMFVHWMNEEWSKNRLDKNALRSNTSIGITCVRHDVPTLAYTTVDKLFYCYRRFLKAFPERLKQTFWSIFKILVFWKDHD